MQTIIPKIWRMETFSRYKKYPTIKRTHARPIFATTLALLIFQPARYTKRYPTSKPTTTKAKTMDSQFTFAISAPIFEDPTAYTKIIDEITAAAI